MLWRLAWRNLMRSPRRTSIVVIAVAIGISGSLLSMAFNYGMIDQMVRTAIDTQLGHVQVHAAGWDDDPRLERRLEDGGRAALRVFEASSSLQAATRRVHGEGLVNSARGSAGIRVVGVEVDGEPGVSRLRDSLVEGEWFGAKRLRAVIGQGLAERLDIGLGDKVAVSVQDAAGELTGGGFRIAGIFRTPSSDFDRVTVLLRLGEAQRLLGMGSAVTEVVAVAIDDGEVVALAQQASAALGDTAEVRRWDELQPLLRYMVQSFDMMAWYLYAAVFTAMAFGIANVLLMAVHERTREIGMLRSIGMPRSRVVSLVVLESLLVTGVGLALGSALALAGAWIFSDGIDLSEFAEGLASYGVGSRLLPVLRARDFVLPLVVAAVTSGVSSLWPAVRAARLRPADALRQT